MVLIGHTEKNTIVLDEPINVPDGIKVKISFVQSNNAKDSTGLCGVWKDERDENTIISEIYSNRSEGRQINL